VTRALTARQRTALAVAVYHGVTQSVEGSMPSLARRGLMARERRAEHGRSVVYWVPTDAGRELAGQIRAEALRSIGAPGLSWPQCLPGRVQLVPAAGKARRGVEQLGSSLGS
jgi:DNA-binding MarR family transcriptional regulator